MTSTNLDDKEIDFDWLQAKFRRIYGHPTFAREGGFFRTKKRKQLLGLFGKAGRDRTKYNFWLDIRKAVKTALIDLQLFIEASSNKDVNQVISAWKLSGLIDALIPTFTKGDPERAKIAYLFIERGLQYLKTANRDIISPHQEQEIENIIALSKLIVLSLLPTQEEKNRFRWQGTYEGEL